MENPKKYINRELSWLDFNARVLQEAENPEVPLLERLRFLGIFSNNLDEFFQVRYATVKRIAQSEKSGKKVLGGESAETLLKQITHRVIKDQKHSVEILNSIENELKEEGICFITEQEITTEQGAFLKEYFIEKISPSLETVILNEEIQQDLTGNRAFLAVRMQLQGSDSISQYAVIELPEDINRFVILPKTSEIQYVILIDDVIRYHLDRIFSIFNYDHIEAHMVKITRDAELDFEEDVSKSYIDKIMESVQDRIVGDPVRLVYDNALPQETLDVLVSKLGIKTKDNLLPGARYHHRRDYMNFPDIGRPDLLYAKMPPLPLKDLSLEDNIIDAIAQKDRLIYTPYHSFSYVIRFLRQAALDPKVTQIKITIYRLSKISNVVNSLINAARNGKRVLVQIELQARFDEANNISYANQLESAGVQLIFGVPGLKVHSKICYVERMESKSKKSRYGFISTGNFNESTAKVYTDFTLFTANPKILKEVNKVFNFLQVNYKLKSYKHLIVSPHYTSSSLQRLIQNEIDHKKAGKPAGIRLKLNSISSYKMIDKLYEASQAGVPIQMIVRGICCIIPQVPGLSENIEIVSVIDRFLEHPRVYIFENAGDPKVYISSADFMTRNIENRVEVACPIYDPDLQKQIFDTFDIAWNDNVKGRLINQTPQNMMRAQDTSAIRSQWDIYQYFKQE
ncbi:MAG: polyphosphate kinase 1 [Flavobacteriaceae bacterium]